MTDLILPGLVIMIPFYWLWRQQVATDARIALLEEINKFLNPKSGNHELTQNIVFNAYEDSRKHFLIFSLFYFVVFKINNEDFNASKQEYRAIDSAQRKKANELVGKILLTNVKLSPIAYFSFGLLMLLLSLIVMLKNTLSLKNCLNQFQMLKEKLLFSIYSY